MRKVLIALVILTFAFAVLAQPPPPPPPPPPGGDSGFPVLLEGSYPAEKIATVTVSKPQNATGTANVSMLAFDPDYPDEGELYVNGNGPATLFGSSATPSNDLKNATVKAATQASWWNDGSNTIKFVHLRTNGFNVYSLSVTFNTNNTVPPPPPPPPPPPGGSAPVLTIISPAQNAVIQGTTVNAQYTKSGNLTGVDHVHLRLDNNAEIMDLDFDGSYQFTGVPLGQHTLIGYLARADHSKVAGTNASVSFSTVQTAQSCSDSTAVDACSSTKPLYCDSSGNLVNKCSVCGCPENSDCQQQTDSCKFRGYFNKLKFVGRLVKNNIEQTPCVSCTVTIGIGGRTNSTTTSQDGTFNIFLYVPVFPGNQLFDIIINDGIQTFFFKKRVVIAFSDTIPPAVAITAPFDNQIVSGAIAVAALATDDIEVDKVEFFLDGASIGEDSSQPYSVQLGTQDLSNGLHILTAVARDKLGNTAASLGIKIIVNNAGPPSDTQAPVRSSGSPSGQLPAGTTQATMNMRTNEDAVCRYSTSQNVAFSSMTNTFSTTGGRDHSTTLTGLSNENTYYYYVRCSDTSGNANTDDFTISFSVASGVPPPPPPPPPGGGDTTAPTVFVSHSPATGIGSTTTVTITATGSDNVALGSIQLFVDGTSVRTCISSPCIHSSTYALGTHTYYATATDTSSNTARDPGVGTKSFTVAAICGNAVIEGSEQCEGTNLAGQTCQLRGFTCGSLACSAACGFDTSACYTTNLQTDRNNCGTCGNVCSGNLICTAGSCVSCGNSVCDLGETQSTCPADCVESIAANNCRNAVDDDRDNEWDYDTGTGAPHGDAGCPVGVTAIGVSSTSPASGSQISVQCTSTVSEVNSISASIDGVGACTWDTAFVWQGNTTRFTCNVSSAGTKTVRCAVDTAKSYKSGTDRIATINVQASDTTPPVRSNGSPTNNLSAGTTSTTISLTTNEAATCKYATSTGVSYSSMTNTFTTTGSTSHSRIITGLTNGSTYNYYVRCIDAANNANTDDFTISFSIASGVPPPPPPPPPPV